MKEKYRKAYLGNKVLINNQFSIIGLIFGPLLLLYRKMFIPSILLLSLTSIVAYYNIKLAVLVEIIIHIIVGFKYNTMYSHHINKKIDEIIISNSEKEEKEIIEICKKKGKPFTPIIFFISIIIIGSIILIPLMINNNKKTPIGKQSLNNLDYAIPNNYHYGKYQSDSYHHYYHIDKKNNCEITITKSNKKEKALLNTSETIKEISINNNKWFYENNNNTDTYLIEHNNTIYKIIYIIKKDNTCTKEKEEFLSSLNFNN